MPLPPLASPPPEIPGGKARVEPPRGPSARVPLGSLPAPAWAAEPFPPGGSDRRRPRSSVINVDAEGLDDGNDDDDEDDDGDDEGTVETDTPPPASGLPPPVFPPRARAIDLPAPESVVPPVKEWSDKTVRQLVLAINDTVVWHVPSETDRVARWAFRPCPGLRCLRGGQGWGNFVPPTFAHLRERWEHFSASRGAAEMLHRFERCARGDPAANRSFGFPLRFIDAEFGLAAELVAFLVLFDTNQCNTWPLRSIIFVAGQVLHKHRLTALTRDAILSRASGSVLTVAMHALGFDPMEETSGPLGSAYVSRSLPAASLLAPSFLAPVQQQQQLHRQPSVAGWMSTIGPGDSASQVDRHSVVRGTGGGFVTRQPPPPRRGAPPCAKCNLPGHKWQQCPRENPDFRPDAPLFLLREARAKRYVFPTYGN